MSFPTSHREYRFSNNQCTFIIFGAPIILLILTLFIPSIIMDLTNVVSALTSTAPLQVTEIHFSMDLGWLFGLLSIAFAIWFGFGDKLRDYLRDSKRSLIDEKIAMLYGYCLRISSWNSEDKEGIRIETLKIRADIRSIGRIKRAIPQDQKTALIFAKEELVTKLRSNHFQAEAHDMDTEFAANLWGVSYQQRKQG